MMLDDSEDVEETIERLQREWLLAGGKDDGMGDKEPLKPSYCYGCARTAGVAVCRKPVSDRKRKRTSSSSSKGPVSQKRGQMHAKSRTIPQLKSTSNLHVSARIKKKALSTLLGQKTGKANNPSSEKNLSRSRAKKPSRRRGEFACFECGQVFTFIHNLRRHQGLHERVTLQTDHDEYSCTECGETFPAKKTYLQHLQRHKHVNNGTERPYACDECDKTFSRTMYLRQHKRVHNTAKPFGCLDCPRMFKTEHHLKCHEETHRAVLPFPCKYCGMAFTRNSYLLLHERVHTKHLQV